MIDAKDLLNDDEALGRVRRTGDISVQREPIARFELNGLSHTVLPPGKLICPIAGRQHGGTGREVNRPAVNMGRTVVQRSRYRNYAK